ncbi:MULTISPECIES: hypothetical protein [unclassified Nitrobacter]|uniref:hypothetical protein n=1 Tax=unclassified Nitrobacter TaxID=2620411 RepID=UPI00092B24AB|nr:MULTISPECIES: hypothetical protein [unclassified Nitrobacter]MBN9148695.1 hypothetical protein [Nitrobacter sp.]OJV01093.1 MAG: hypothetical protein BGO16_10375 [Nitrobacter sp. 62-23]
MSESDQTDVIEAVVAPGDAPDVSDERDAGEAHEPETTDQPELEVAEDMPPESPIAADLSAADPSSDVAQDDAYTKFGPGPLVAVRFKWTARRHDNGDYFVHETIGESSYPLVTGPMTREAAIEFVDDRERDARRRFEELRSEMAGGEIGRRADE